MNENLIRQFDSIEFAENPETRCPCVLLLDTSGSMDGEKITALNRGLKTFQRALQRDELAAQRVEVGIVTFGPVHVAQEFMSAQQFEAPSLIAQHATPMGQAVEKAIQMIEEKRSHTRPMGLVIIDRGCSSLRTASLQMTLPVQHISCNRVRNQRRSCFLQWGLMVLGWRCSGICPCVSRLS